MGPPTKYVTSVEIREVFAEGRYFERWSRGEFATEVFRQGPPLLRPGESFPDRFQKQMVLYRERGEEGRTIAAVHERAGDENGNPAEGTWADPKYVYHDGVRYRFSEEAEARLLASLDALFEWLCGR
jgi:hypothetical protein